MGSQQKAHQVSALMSLLFKLLAKRFTTLVILLDDAQWLDSASWAFTNDILQSVPNVALVISIQAQVEYFVPAILIQILDLPNTHQYTLHTMDPQQVDRLVSELLGVETIPREVSEVVYNKSQGNPFFSTQVALALYDQKALRIENGVCSVVSKNMDKIELPTSLNGIITSRIDNLSPQQQMLLKVASVIGSTFSVHLLVHVHPIKTMSDSIVTDLAYLQKMGLLEKIPSTDVDVLCRFKHTYTLDAAYSMMLYSDRRKVHLKVAYYYEEYHSSNIERYYSLLSYHYGKAHDYPNTVINLELAAAQALRSFANQEAVTLYTSLLELYNKMLTDGESMFEEYQKAQNDDDEQQLLIVDNEDEEDDSEDEFSTTAQRTVTIFVADKAPRRGSQSDHLRTRSWARNRSISIDTDGSDIEQDTSEPDENSILDIIHVDSHRLATWKRHLGTALYNAGEVDNAYEWLESALTDMQITFPSSDFKLKNSIKLEKGKHSMRKHNYVETAGTDLTDQERDQQTNVVLGLIYLARCALFRCEINMASYCIWRSLNLAEKLGPCGALLEAYALAINILMESSSNKSTQKTIDQIMDKAEIVLARTNRLQSSAHYRLVEGTLALSRGYFTQAEKSLTMGIKDAGQVGDVRLKESLLVALSYHKFLSGNLVRSAVWSKLAILSSRNRGDPCSQAIGHNARVFCMAGMGKMQQSLDAVLQVERLIEEEVALLDLTTIANATALKAWAQVQLHEWELAWDSVSNVYKMYKDNALPPQFSSFLAFFSMSEVILHLWHELESAQSTSSASAKKFAKMATDYSISNDTLKTMAEDAIQWLTDLADLHECFVPRKYTLSCWFNFMIGKETKSFDKGIKAEKTAKNLNMKFEQVRYHQITSIYMDAMATKIHKKKEKELLNDLGLSVENE
eukprot:TRINITY_DN771_c0_g1_i8.p2 TRINITY_DN771_c0_g1~~TRINITY_DN771_c0_g1_i8.p2  ORF type:complete len:911 (-),score=277.15 TRINITY_DN771_c0_g1_i8:1988-4720(-)